MLPKPLRSKMVPLVLCVLSLVLIIPHARSADTSLPMFEAANFSGSGICAICHSGLEDEAGNDVSNDAHWRSTMMANAAKDPLWQAKVSAEIALNGAAFEGAAAQIIQEKCSRCHMGMARYQQIADGADKTDVYILGETGFLSPDHDLHEAAMDGVSCTLCHQIQAENLGTAESFTGQYLIDTTALGTGRVLFGPNGRMFANPMEHMSGFVPTDHAPDMQMADSTHCASCHTLYTPALDGEGNYLGEFPEQTTYLEWLHSEYSDPSSEKGQTCQSCHMPEAVGEVAASNRPKEKLTPVTPFNQHHFVGGNSFMVDLLNTHADELGVTAEPAHLDATAERTLAQLQQATARVSATASRSEEDGRLKVAVNVENLAGHKFPNGFPSRRTWLHVTVAKASGEIVFESGKPLGDGSIEGNDGDLDSGEFEPHYTTITASDEVQIYEPVMLNYEGDLTFTLLRAWEYAKDNRLLPLGFDKKSAEADIAVYGEAVDDGDFLGGSDQILYDLDMRSAKGNLTVTVELLFQSLSYPFIADLGKVDTSLVDNFMTLYNPTENAPVVVAETQISVQ